MEEEKTLRRMAEAFKELATSLSQCPDGEEARLELGPFSHACSLVSPLFRCLGIAFKFAELDYVAKVNDLVETSKSITVLPVMINEDVKSDCVRTAGSHTRNLLRVKRGVDMVKVLFEHILSLEGNSLKDPASKAYAQVFAPYHGWAIRKAVAAGMYALPSKAQLLNKLNEDAKFDRKLPNCLMNSELSNGGILTGDVVHLSETSARIQMQSYVASAAPVVKYIDQLFISRGLGIDW